MITIKRENNVFQVFSDGEKLGEVDIRENKYHSRCAYLELKLDQYKREDSQELFQKLILQIDKPLQIMISSKELQIIDFIKEAGFSCKRKSFEVEVTKEDYLESVCNLLPLYTSYKGSDEYDESCKILFKHYKNTHGLVSPLTCDYKSFVEMLPEKLSYIRRNQEITNLAFIEYNEIAYLASIDKGQVKDFLYSLTESLFKKYENIFFESDDCDQVAMDLYNLFKHKDRVSYDTYIKELG